LIFDNFKGRNYQFVSKNMNENCQNAETFLSELIGDLRFDLSVSSEWTDEGCLLNLSGQDVPFLLNENGEMLDALEVLLFQIYGRELERTHRFICDAEGFRQSRKAELQAMARFAAQNVRKNGRPFTFGKLNSTERRIIHLTLQTEADLITESVGDGRERRLQVRLK
jgi:spoIIIJ-associated protein